MRIVTPFDAWRAGLEMARLGIEAQAVLWLRTMGAAGAWNTPFDEGWRAVREKPEAFVEALGRAVEAASRGQPAPQVISAAVGPLTRAARDNRCRLEGRGRYRWSS